MTTHELAQLLLAGPDVPALVFYDEQEQWYEVDEISPVHESKYQPISGIGIQ